MGLRGNSGSGGTGGVASNNNQVFEYGGFDSNIANNLKTYISPHGQQNPSSQSIVQHIVLGRAIIVKKFYINFRFNSGSTLSIKFSLRRNGVNTPMSVSVPALQTGIFSVTGNESFAIGDKIQYEMDNPNLSGTYRFDSLETEYEVV